MQPMTPLLMLVGCLAYSYSPNMYKSALICELFVIQAGDQSMYMDISRAIPCDSFAPTVGQAYFSFAQVRVLDLDN